MKYNPGFKYQYISRYCHLTISQFKYYKNELMSMKHVFALFEVNIANIERVERVSIDIPVTSEIE